MLKTLITLLWDFPSKFQFLHLFGGRPLTFVGIYNPKIFSWIIPIYFTLIYHFCI